MTIDVEEVGTFGELRTDGVMRAPSRLSFSSISTYSECGELWRLTRGFKQGEDSWWANVGGSTVHELTELYDKAELPEWQEDPRGAWATVFAKYEAEFDGVELRASSKKNLACQCESTSGDHADDEYVWAGSPVGKDRKWWMIFGPQMVDAYIRWRNTWGSDFEITDIELAYEVEVGGELLIGHVDRVEIHRESGAIYIRDIKTGSSGNYLQLAMYREALRVLTGFAADYGDMIKFRWKSEKVEVPAVDENGDPLLYVRGTKKGQQKTITEDRGYVECFASRATDFTGHTSEFIEHQLDMARRGIEGGIFMGNLRNNCQYCGVSDYCRHFGGKEALTFPVKTTIEPRKQATIPSTPSA